MLSLRPLTVFCLFFGAVPNSPGAENGEPPAPVGSTALVFAQAFADTLHVKRSHDVDHLALTGGTVVKGTFSATKIQMQSSGQTRELPGDRIAAIRGGRHACVYLRDGSVTIGSLTWGSASFESSTLGRITLKAETLDGLVLRTRDDDGRLDFRPAAWIAEEPEGQVTAWKTFPTEPLQVIWAGGQMALKWEEMKAVQRLPLPSPEHQVILRDGSRLLVWMNHRASVMAETPESLLSLLAGAVLGTKIEGPSLLLADGSEIAGSLAETSLPWFTQDGELQVKTADIRKIRRHQDGALFVLQTKAEASLLGRPADAALQWKRGSQTIHVPWRLISELKPASKP